MWGNRMNVILCGYNWTGAKALKILKDKGHNVFVYTHKMENCCVDVEGMCIRQNIPYTFEKIRLDNMPFIPDVICSIYYRYIIGADVIEAVQGRIFNLHPALLPKYRGCSSLTWAMINGEEKCGFTYHYIDNNCDTGDIIIQREVMIEPFDTQSTLYNRVMFEAMDYFYEAFGKVAANKPGTPQSGESSLYKRGCPMGGILETDSSAAYADRFIRAMINPPYKPAQCEGKSIYTIREFLEMKDNYEGGR